MAANGRSGIDGQASVEWLALVTLVVALLGLGAALAQAGFVGRHVTREMARALCVVRHGDCRRDREPCVTHAEQGAVSQRYDVLVVRLGSDAVVRIEQLSDGTVAVTKATGMSYGLVASAGPAVRVRVKGVDVGVGLEVEAGGDGRHGTARTWIVGSWAQAQALLDDLRPLRGGAPRPPDLESGDRGLALSASGSAGVRGPVTLDAAHGSLTFDGGSRTVVDHRTGHRTIVVTARATAGGDVLGLSGSTASGGERYAVELDATGRPVDLQILAAGAFGGSQDLPGVVQPVVGLLERGGADGRTYEITSHLDLTDRGNLAAARALLDAIARGGARSATATAAQTLRRRVDEQGTVEARVLRTRTTTDGLGAEGSFGLHVGARVDTASASSQLLAAASRGLDGQWLVRGDCAAG